MKKYIMPILSALLVGFLLAKFMINQYDKKENLKTVFNSYETLYFIQQGVYSTKESMEKNMSDFAYYIYNIENDKYYTYIGITKTKENSDKLKGFYEKLGYITYIKEINVDNIGFVEILNQYDQLLETTEDENTIKAICSQVLSKYEELILNEREN
ncbi:MAG: hypothetical protein E7169_02545 [Firmicutes bacterium]|nr:hypothetical protein [Bacillota bacterium]